MSRLRNLFAVLALAAAAASGEPLFREAEPPPGIVNGCMSAGGRTGAVIAGGRTVFSNDTFTVTHMGQNTTWKVLGFDGMKAR